ncbi:MAG: RNA methyltransferase [Flavobacteriales bacterium CG03_land_8_20_14_0_80_35_15]|nr:methyltransferase domain-containing protein [Zetaproteobacteria bacterium]NDK18276.1 methyltransferase domain-containing protein [Flavobacteriales bacterium]OIO13008.1 MAG: RNA methyltransferase [Flavobacteriaceae bacterium CG1_02_35_72]PIR12537.1 MAG: RNA methyltransferase [Flavobacteriales bacterium CG11_big_fil_rev_8_21_14_0_20_35_7]PIV16286.1 MAG: RNA methyltransferase [Flavobacteriales bacterium CG03_land_8_20_14_0_80_35_15]PIX05705.1 MAG: RNA methyltransferase [Flavobacteriales bacter
MRLHKNLVIAVIDSLDYIFNDGLMASKVVETTLKRDKRWGSHDRKFLAETIYEMVRWRRLYNEIAGTKNHFTKDNLWKLFAVWAVLKGIKLPEWSQLAGTPERHIKGLFDNFQKTRKIKESIPDWLDELGEKELGVAWNDELHALNQPADVILRANRLKGSKLMLQKSLDKEGIETESLKNYPDALVLKERQNVFTSQAFKDGLFEVQDASSQLVAYFLDVKPGMRVIDACAGAGGKTLHLASLMENKGQIIALDIYKNKLNELKRRAKRNGAFNIEPRFIESTKTIKKLHSSADRLLIDAPCSGLGVLKRNPDAKWKLQPEFLDTIKATQKELLENYSKMLKLNGLMVYATCSILPSENQLQVAEFLKNNANFKLVKEATVSPHKTGFDGFYMAQLERIA